MTRAPKKFKLDDNQAAFCMLILSMNAGLDMAVKKIHRHYIKKEARDDILRILSDSYFMLASEYIRGELLKKALVEGDKKLTCVFDPTSGDNTVLVYEHTDDPDWKYQPPKDDQVASK